QMDYPRLRRGNIAAGAARSRGKRRPTAAREPFRRPALEEAKPQAAGSGSSFLARFRFAIALRDGAPVHHVPPGIDVVGTLVLIFQVVGMLPDVDAEDGRLAVHEGAILVRRAEDLQLAVGEDEPGPAAAEAADAGLLDL